MSAPCESKWVYVRSVISRVKVVLISDLHGNLPEIPECDLLVIAGDVTPVHNHAWPYQKEWLSGRFSNWLRDLPVKNIVGVGGNHDFALVESNWHRDVIPWTYLKDESVEIEGLKIWGSPYSNKFGNWTAMLPEGMLQEKWRKIPRDIDILVVHGPAHGIGDFVPAATWSAVKRGWENLETGEHVGSTSLSQQLSFEEWPNLKLFAFGHIHEGYGHYKMGKVDAYNASYVNGEYEPGNPPWEVEL